MRKKKRKETKPNIQNRQIRTLIRSQFWPSDVFPTCIKFCMQRNFRHLHAKKFQTISHIHVMVYMIICTLELISLLHVIHTWCVIIDFCIPLTDSKDPEETSKWKDNQRVNLWIEHMKILLNKTRWINAQELWGHPIHVSLIIAQQNTLPSFPLWITSLYPCLWWSPVDKRFHVVASKGEPGWEPNYVSCR